MPAPDIVVVLSDQQRPDSCGVYGQRLPVTPNLDAMAADGRGVRQRLHRAAAVRAVTRVAPDGDDADAPRLLAQRARAPARHRHARDAPRARSGTAPATWASGTSPRTAAVCPRAAPRRSSARNRSRRNGEAGTPTAGSRPTRSNTHRGPNGGHVFDADGERVELEGYRVDAITDSGDRRAPRARRPAAPALRVVPRAAPPEQPRARRRAEGMGGTLRAITTFPATSPDARATGVGTTPSISPAAPASTPTSAGCSPRSTTGRGADEHARASTPATTATTSAPATSTSSAPATTRRSASRSWCAARGSTPATRSDALVTLLDVVPTLVTAAGGDDPRRRRDGAAARRSATIRARPGVRADQRVPDRPRAPHGHAHVLRARAGASTGVWGAAAATPIATSRTSSTTTSPIPRSGTTSCGTPRPRTSGPARRPPARRDRARRGVLAADRPSRHRRLTAHGPVRGRPSFTQPTSARQSRVTPLSGSVRPAAGHAHHSPMGGAHEVPNATSCRRRIGPGGRTRLRHHRHRPGQHHPGPEQTSQDPYVVRRSPASSRRRS